LRWLTQFINTENGHIPANIHDDIITAFNVKEAEIKDMSEWTDYYKEDLKTIKRIYDETIASDE